jgi:RNAPII transcription regulator C-terminal
LTRGDPRALSLTENLFDLFSDEAINWDAASSIGRIAAATDVLTKTNYAVTKVCTRSTFSDGPMWAHCRLAVQFLAVQKFTNALLPRLMKNAQASSGRLVAIKEVNPGLTTGRPSGPDGISRRVIVAHKGDTEVDLRPRNARRKQIFLAVTGSVGSYPLGSSSCRCYFAG